MTVDPTQMDDINKLRQLMKNAERLGRDEIAHACKQRIFQLSGGMSDDILDVRLQQAVAAYEETLLEKHGRRQKASYTRRKMGRVSSTQVLADWANDASETPGFKALVENGLAEFTAEYIVAEYPDRFDPATVANAVAKLAKHGVRTP